MAFDYLNSIEESVVARGLEGKVIMVYGSNNLGKEQPVSEPVLTEKGFKPIGEIKIGDKVYGQDGELHPVTEILPQGEKDVYKITFTDGTSTRCGLEHLWKVYTKNLYQTNLNTGEDRHKIMPLQDMLNDYKTKNNKEQDIYKYSIPINNTINFKHKEVKIPPYLLGAMLGDGSFRKTTSSFTNPEKDVVEKVRRLVEELGFELNDNLPDKNLRHSIVDREVYKKNRFNDLLDFYKLNNLDSHDKFIPDDYLYNSEQVRLEILQGLIDTDGSYRFNSSLSFSSVSLKLIEGVEFLVRSLGGITSRHMDKREGKESYYLFIRIARKDILTSKKHLDRGYLECIATVKKSIKNIEMIGKEESVCIYVDSEDHLYLTNDFIVTHNSKNATKFPDPVVFPFETSALNAIGGASVIKKVNDWASFRDFTDSIYRDKLNYEKDLANLQKSQNKPKPKDKEEAEALEEKIQRLQKKVDESPYIQFKNRFKTLVLDSATALDKSVEKYILDEAGATSMRDVEYGVLYKQWENEAYHTFNKFFSLGDFTYLILAHEDFRKTGELDKDDEPVYQAYPKGDKRVIRPIVNLCDIIVFLKSNGLDENHKVIPSSAILGECDLCFARSKWDNMDLFIPEFSAKNLEEVINKAINEQEQNGVKVGSYREQQQSTIDKLTVDWKEVQSKIIELAKKIYAHDDEDAEGVNMTKYNEIVEEFLGKGGKVSEAGAKQIGSLQNILSRTEDLIEELI